MLKSTTGAESERFLKVPSFYTFMQYCQMVFAWIEGMYGSYLSRDIVYRGR